MRIDDITLNIIPDSSGNTTLEAVFKYGPYSAIASVPSGKSKGVNEAYVLDPERALEKFNGLRFNLFSRNFDTLEEFDSLLLSLDGTPGKQKLGGNLILVLSMGFTKLMAQAENMELYNFFASLTDNTIKKLPLCFFNLIEGGVHTQDSLPFQEYLLVPKTHSPKESLNKTIQFIQMLQDKINLDFGQLRYGDEGGFCVPSIDPLLGLHLLQELRSKTGFTESWISLDVAASSLYENGVYKVGDSLFSMEQLINLYKNIASDFPILSIEDPFEESDWEGFTRVTSQLGNKIWVVGDDLTTTNPGRIELAYQKGAINAVIIKPTQIGSVTETLKAALVAKASGWKVIVSHRSGETLDTFIADLAVGLQADALKSGCPLQKERLVKYQRLIEIEERL